jgi:NADH:ubiquinone oxidoreductase subunit 5 (subunit L)/multisubunit Na+/H+ antiporter MnhA subunit
MPGLYEHARETPVLWGPLVVLAILAILSGRLMNVQEMLEGSLRENTAWCRQYDPAFNGFATAWPTTTPEERIDTGDVVPINPTQSALDTGHAMVEKYLAFWGFAIGMTLAFILYFRGLGASFAISRFPLIRPFHTWLYNRMYFDELYFSVFVGSFAVFARLLGWIDRNIVDGLVNQLADWVRRSATVVEWADRQWVDGTVIGVGTLAQTLGVAVRLPQTGRIRGYVMIVMIAATLAIAGAVIVVLSH